MKITTKNSLRLVLCHNLMFGCIEGRMGKAVCARVPGVSKDTGRLSLTHATHQVISDYAQEYIRLAAGTLSSYRMGHDYGSWHRNLL